MKKSIISFLLFCIGCANTINAENTDLSAIDNVIYVASNPIGAGETAELSICMKNIAPIRGFQINLYLPEGVKAIKNAKGRIQATLNAGRLEEDDEHTLSVSEQENGSLLLLCGSHYPEDFIGNNGEIATLRIAVARNVEKGEYPVILRKIKLTETNISKYYETSEIITTLIITESIGPQFIIGDINGDLSITNDDVMDLVDIILGKQKNYDDSAADVNDDGRITVADVTALVNMIRSN